MIFEKIFTAVSIALQNIKANPLHTFLSILGVVIGVAALVAILTLADGLEQFIREDVSQKISLNEIKVSSVTRENIDGISISLKEFPVISPNVYGQLKKKLKNVSSTELASYGSGIIYSTDSDVKAGTNFTIVEEKSRDWKENIEYGKGFDEGTKGILITTTLADRLYNSPTSAIGNDIRMMDRVFTIQGILKEDRIGEQLYVMFPYKLFNENQLRSFPPALKVIANTKVLVPEVQKNIKAWLHNNFKEGAEAFHLITGEQQLQPAFDGLKVFKIIMGLITGISVVVGGIGIMNVLLISITEKNN